jgi:tetratricopeptide (TPR) repeat protein
MRRFLVLISILVFAGALPAQQPVDYLIKAKAFKESGKYSEAISLLSEALVKTKDYRFYTERAEVYIANGDLLSAKADFETANSLLSYTGEYGLARICALLGDAGNSLMHLENNINSPLKKGEKEILLDNAFSSIENTP